MKTFLRFVQEEGCGRFIFYWGMIIFFAIVFCLGFIKGKHDIAAEEKIKKEKKGIVKYLQSI